MAKQNSQPASSSGTAILELPGEREQIFELFRRWGYVEAKLDPLGFLRPQPHPELPTEGEIAQEARRIYCGSIGVEFSHITDPARRLLARAEYEIAGKRVAVSYPGREGSGPPRAVTIEVRGAKMTLRRDAE